MAKAPRSLSGKVVAITGGARGIGRATATALIAQGARVAIGDIDATMAAQTAQELGAGTIGLPLDVTNPESFALFLDELESRLGALDVLVNNAGIMPVGPFVDETDETARRMVDINLHGVILGSKLALRRFLPRGRGHIVNIASSAGKTGLPGGATYCATKHAVVGLSEAIRQEYRQHGIDVSIVMPIPVNTELGSGLGAMRGLPVVEPGEVADAIVDALRTRKVDIFLPKRVQVLLRLQPVIPRPVVDLIGHVVGSDRVLWSIDHNARGAYEARIAAEEAAAARAADAADAADAEAASESQSGVAA